MREEIIFLAEEINFFAEEINFFAGWLPISCKVEKFEFHCVSRGYRILWEIFTFPLSPE